MNQQIDHNKKPLIGISMRFELGKRQLNVPLDYSEAVEYAGGIPMHLSLLPQADYIKNVLQFVDGILLPGGGDIEPLRYNCEPKIGLGTVSPLRDENDLILLKMAEEMSIPVLGICYGMQLLNVFRGGTLIQDIERERQKALQHRQGEPRDRLSHWISIAENSLLFEAQAGNKFLVNSHHHQAVADVGRDLSVTATANDGIIEAIEDSRPNKFNLGVQWHPEICFKENKLSQKIFEQFVSAAARRKHLRSF